MIISIMQNKGGAGKTTIAVNLACGLQQLKGLKILLVDSDLQRSARDWHALNEGEKLDVIGLDTSTIDKDLKRFGKDYDHVIVDGGPRLSHVTAKTIVASDIILVPVQPSPYDVWACENLVNLIKQRQEITNDKLKAFFVISRRIMKTNIGKDFDKALQALGLPVLGKGTCQRVSYMESANKGQSVLDTNDEKAKEEINELVRLLLVEI